MDKMVGDEKKRIIKESRKQRVRESKLRVLHTYYLNEDNKLKVDNKY